jgi:hypothetical protein
MDLLLILNLCVIVINLINFLIYGYDVVILTFYPFKLIYVLNLIDPPNLNNTTKIPKPTADSDAVSHNKKFPNKYPFKS